MNRTLLILAAALCLQAGSGRAADLKDYSAKTHWVLSLDLQAAQASPLVQFMASSIEEPKRIEAQNKLNAFKTIFGFDLLKDIDQLIVVGDGNAEQGGVAYIYGRFDSARLTSIIAGSKNFASADCQGFRMLSWLDEKDNKPKSLCFAKPGLALLSNGTNTLVEALEVMAGKQPCLASDSPLSAAFARAPQNILGFNAFDVSSLVGQAPKAEVLRQTQGLSLCVRAADAETLEAVLSVTAPSDEKALQIQQAVMGLQAMLQLQAEAKPELAALASQTQVTSKDRTIGVTLKISKPLIEKALAARQARQTAAAAAPDAAAAPAAAN